MRASIRTKLVLAGVALATFGAACAGGSDDEPSPVPTSDPTTSPDGGTGTIEVVLGEWSVLPDPEQAAAGDVDFEATNEGKEVHEFVVIGTDLDPSDLPTADDGSIDEEEVEILGEIEDIAAGDRGDLALELDPGTYVLACNIVETEEDGTVEAHYKLGMRTAFTTS